MKKNMRVVLFGWMVSISFVLILSCNSSIVLKDKIRADDKLFSLVPSKESRIDFANKIEETLYLNFINYPYIYNGGGVSAGDINNDGLIDLYFTANQGTNKLYLNQGNFKFKDITTVAGVNDVDGWTTGSTMVDINDDGYLDIYQ